MGVILLSLRKCESCQPIESDLGFNFQKITPLA
jgi:hypothetical protein